MFTKTLDNVENTLYNSLIYGLVPRGSTYQAKETPAKAGFVKAVGILPIQALHAATKPKASLAGFFVSGATRTPHVSKHLNRGGAEGKRTRYDASLGGSSRTIRATGRIIKSGACGQSTA